MTGSAKEKKAGGVMETARKWAAGWMLLMLGAGAGLDASAQTPSKYPWDEYDKRVESAKQAAALKSDLFGDQVNLANGSLSFTATDVAIPGNNALPVGISRSYSVQNRYETVTDQMMADWDIDAPSISGSFASNWQSRVPGDPGRRCSAPAHQASPPSPVWDINVWDFWQGNTLNVPGAGGELLQVRPGAYLPSTGGPYYWMTTSQTYVSCLPTIKNTTGEGFLAITPDGTKYWFDWMAQYREPNLSSANGGSNIARRKNVLYATKVQDRFGNTVEYTYTNAWNAPGRLTGIVSSDGRQLAITYNGQGHIATVVQGTRTWTYQYVAAGTRRSLSAVIQPDGAQWTIGFSPFTSATIQYPMGAANEPTRDCFVRLSGPIGPTEVSGTIQHPSGATGTFTVGWLRHGRSNVPVACQNFDVGGEFGTNTNDDTNQWTIAYEAYSLTKKRITGPGLTASEWNYTYTPNISYQFYPGGDMMTPCPMGTMCGEPICMSDACAGRAETLVLGPDGERTKYFHGNSYRYNEGKLLRVERGSTTTPLMDVQVSTFDLSMAPQVYPERFGYSLRENFDGFVSEYHRPQLSATTTRDGVDFKYQVELFDALARPLRVKRFNTSAYAHAKTEVMAYRDSQAGWILGQTESVACVLSNPASTACDGDVVSSATFDPATSLPVTQSSFGRLIQTLTYNADGTVATVKDGNNNVTAANNWKRGIPQVIQYPPTPEAPAGAVESAVVNDNGWITSVTDENGYTTGYGYDAMGRLASIVYPTGDSTAWNTETFTFTPVQQDEHGLAPGHWTMRRRLGNRHVNTYYDALWRPVLEESLDYADIGGTLSQVVKRYDHEGRIVFQSYPKRGVDRPNESQGIHTIYDALGRTTSSSQDSEQGLLTTLTEYLPGFQTRVTNPRGFQTLIQYQAFDQPIHDFPTGITQFAGADTSATEIHRDIFGKPQRIRKRNADGSLFLDRHYVYDGFQQLCKAVEPETGATIMDYDGAGNLQWSASGLHNLMGTSSCDTIAGRDSGRKVTRYYDARNRLSSLQFPDGKGNQAWEYWPDGLPYKITTHNDALGAGIVENTYAYNKRRMLTGESSSQQGWYTWGLGYAYDANGSLSTQTYPTGLAINYAPNALGQSTQARDQSGSYYASGASYYPNGAIKQFTYGNGIVHSMSQNARQLPQDVVSSGGVLHDRYTYDANGNVASILDVQDGGHLGWALRNRYLGYDGLDRLTAAGSGSFGGDHWHRFAYNALDNLTWWRLGGIKDHTYIYDGRNQLGNLKNPDGSTVVGFGYDPQGNLQNKNGQMYGFDYGNRLRTVVDKENYRYDGHGRRVLAWEVASTQSILSMYATSGQVMYEENYRPAAQKATEHIYLAGSVIASRDRNIVTNVYDAKFHHTDALGSPIAVTNQAGTVIERNDYEPYGAVIGKPNYQGIGYTGHVQDAATGLTYMQQRYYDPQVGLFLSVDPVTAYGSPVGMFNRYRYANSNPYRFIDPDGRDATWIQHKDGSSTLVIKVMATGSGANDALTSQIEGAVEGITFPRADVRIDVQFVEKAGRGVNTLDLSPGNGDCRSSGCVNKLGGNKGHADSSRSDVVDVAKHEILHFPGISDAYIEGKKDSNGNRTSTPKPGYDKTNAMTSRGGNTLKDEQLDEARANKSTKKENEK
jgi:RHS repeat-associated protein